MTENYGVVTQNGAITSLISEEIDNPSLNVYTTEPVVRKLLQSDNGIDDLQKALKHGEITYKAVGIVNKIRFGLISMILKLFSSSKDSSVLVTGSVVVDDPEPELIEEQVSESNENEYVVKLTEDGFEPVKLNVKSGDKVVWKNERSAKAMILGTRKCRDVKSKIFESGESYEYTFIEKGRCDIVDGIMTTKSSVINVE